MEAVTEDVSLPWRWIMEHLVDMKDIGTPILRELMTYIPNLAHLSSLHTRTALRYLEEAIAGSRIDAQIIPLVVVLLKESQRTSSFPTSSDYRALLLRVQVEAVIAHVRGRQKDWQGFSRAIDRFFPENAVDSHVLKKRAELLSLLQEQSRERKYKEVVEMYSLTALRRDLLKCISAEKGRLVHTFLDKLLQDVFNGTYPVSAESIGKPASEKEESQEDFHSADGQKNSTGSDDQTIIGGRNSNVESEEADETHLKDSAATHSAINDLKNDAHRTPKKRNSAHNLSESNRATKKMSHEHPELRQRDQHGKAITSTSPMKAMREKGMQEPSSKLTDKEKVALETADNSLQVELLNLGSDGHEEFCHKCKEGGRLLCCDGCPIAVHRKCLGFDPKSFTEEDWFCPLCAQKRAAEAVVKAREEESAARKRVQQFMASVDGGANEKQRPSSSKRTSEQSIGRKLIDKMDCGDGQQDCARKSTLKRHGNKQASSPSKETSKQVLASCKRSTSIDPYEAWLDISSKGGRPAHHSSTQVSDVALEHEGGKRKTEEELKKQAAVCDGNIENSTKHSAEIHRTTDQGHTHGASSSKADPTNQADMPMEQVNIQGQAGDGDGHDGDLEEDSESRKPKSPKPKKDRRLYFRGNRIIPGLRRKRLQWTKEEEDALREGVKRFSHDNGSWGFQWTRILEFGYGKFHPSRTDVDLKDKWRNLSKLF